MKSLKRISECVYGYAVCSNSIINRILLLSFFICSFVEQFWFRFAIEVVMNCNLFFSLWTLWHNCAISATVQLCLLEMMKSIYQIEKYLLRLAMNWNRNYHKIALFLLFIFTSCSSLVFITKHLFLIKMHIWAISIRYSRVQDTRPWLPAETESIFTFRMCIRKKSLRKKTF